MNWTVLISQNLNAAFVTSDNPVLIADPGRRPGEFCGIGLASKTIEVTFPLTKHACLLLTADNERFEQYSQLRESGKNEEAERVRNTFGPISRSLIDDGFVDQINKRTVRGAERFVYSPSKIAWITELLRGPCEAPRMRVSLCFADARIRT
jgi:hypothetical protein